MAEQPMSTAEQTARFEARFQEDLADPDSLMHSLLHAGADRGFLRDVFFSGQWLADQLEALGCDSEQCVKLCFAHGQQCLLGDPWGSARKILAGYRAGHPEQPGPELAARIEKELRERTKGADHA